MTDTKVLTDRDRMAAVLRSVADAVQIVQTPTPTSVTMWAHRLPLADFLIYADRHGVEIELRTPAGDGPATVAVLTIKIGADILASGYEVFLHASCFDLAPDALQAYERHNDLLAEL